MATSFAQWSSQRRKGTDPAGTLATVSALLTPVAAGQSQSAGRAENTNTAAPVSAGARPSFAQWSQVRVSGINTPSVPAATAQPDTSPAPSGSFMQDFRAAEKQNMAEDTANLRDRMLFYEQRMRDAQARMEGGYAPGSEEAEKAAQAYNVALQQYEDVRDRYKAAVEAGEARDPFKDAGNIIKGAAYQGSDKAISSITSTLSWLVGLTGWKENPFTKVDRVVDKWAEQNEAYFSRVLTPQQKKAEEIGSQVVAAVPQAALAFVSGGTSAAGQATTAGLRAASAANAVRTAASKLPRLAQTLNTAVQGMVKNPQFWLAFAQVAGPSYDEAKEDGASELKASLYGLVNGLLNSTVEIGGGGIQTLPAELRSGSASAVRRWVETMLDEGKEEVVQGVVERMLQNLIYQADNPLASTTDPGAIFNPVTAAKEFGGGALVGGILGGGQLAVNAALNRGGKPASTLDAAVAGEGPVGAPAVLTEKSAFEIVAEILAGPVTNSRAEIILDNEANRAAFEAISGQKLAGTKAQQRAQIKTAAQSAVSAPQEAVSQQNVISHEQSEKTSPGDLKTPEPGDLAQTEPKETAGQAALEPYSQQEAEKFFSGAKNKILGFGASIRIFVKNALADRTVKDRLYMGKVTAYTVEAVKSATGMDISGYHVLLDSDAVRHIQKNHGNAQAEALRGHRAVTEADYEMIPQVIAQPDSVYPSQKTDNRGRQVLVFEKEIGDTVITAQAVTAGRHTLSTDTLYIIRRNQRPGLNAGTSPSQEHHVRNEPEQGPALVGSAGTEGVPLTDTSNATISPGSNHVKTKDSEANGNIPVANDKAEGYNKSTGGRSRELVDVISRLNSGETVFDEEIAAIPEVAEAESILQEPTINLPGREKVRQDAYDALMARGSWNGKEYAGPVRRERRADIVIGLPGSGKSSVYTERLSQEHGARVIDTDDAREFIPEYNGMNAAAVHEEASLIKEWIYETSVMNGDNIILSIVGDNAEKLQRKIFILKENGYTVALHLNELPNDKAIARALSRYVNEDGSTGRYVSPFYIRGLGDTPTQTYKMLTEMEGLLDEYDWYNNDVGLGQPPTLRQTSKNPDRTISGSNQKSGEDRGGNGSQAIGVRAQEETGSQSVGAAEAGFAPFSQWQNETPQSGFHPINQEAAEVTASERGRAPSPVPKVNLEGKLTSKTASTLLNAGVTTNDLAQALEAELAAGNFARMAYTDTEAGARAEKRIENEGWEKVYAAYLADVRAGKSSKDITALGTALYNNAANSGDMASALNIASLMVQNARETARALQALNMINKARPETRLYMAMQSLENMQGELEARHGDKAPDLHIDNALMAEYYQALKDGNEEAERAAWERIEQNIADQIPAAFIEKANAWRYMAMLGNPRTHIRNIVGNAGFMPVRMMKNAVAAGIEMAAGIDVRTKALLNPLSAPDRALLQAGWADYTGVADTIMNAGKYDDTRGSIEKKRTIFNNPLIENPMRWISAALEAEDQWFARPAYAASLAGWLKANKITAAEFLGGTLSQEMSDAARAYAVKEAQKATYRDSNDFSDFVARLGRNYRGANKAAKAANVLVEGVLPFKRTPANILARGVEYSPVGLLNGIKQLAFDVKSGKRTAAEAIDTLSAGLTGTGILALGALLASMGLLTAGGSGDDKQDEFDKLRGGQDYALTIGDRSFTLDWLAPEALPLFMGAQLWNNWADGSGGTFKDFLDALTNITEPLLETTMLSSLNDLVDSVRYAKSSTIWSVLASAATSYLTQFIPTLGGQVERAFTETTRQTTFVDRSSPIPNDVQYLLGSALNKIPSVEYGQVPYVDAWGRTQSTGGILERIFNNFINPAYVSRDRSTSVDDELQRLYDAGFTGVFPVKASQATKIGGDYLSAEEYTAYQTARGQTALRLLEEFMGGEKYAGLSDAEKAEFIKRVYDFADYQAKLEVDAGVDAPAWVRKAAESADRAAYLYAVAKYGTDGAESLSRLSNAGLALDVAEKVYKAVAGVGSGKSADKYAAIAGLRIPEADKLAALTVYTTDAAMARYRAASGAGISVSQWTAFTARLDGSPSQAEVRDAAEAVFQDIQDRRTAWKIYADALGWKAGAPW